MTDMTTLLVGAGYVGTALAHTLAERSIDCDLMVASKRSAARLKTLGLDCLRVDFDSSPHLEVPACKRIVYLVPPKRGEEWDVRLAHFLSALPAPPTAFLYVSTSGVYGDQQGRLVEEHTPTAPHSARAHRRLNAETQVRQWASAHGVRWTIARVPGIYGPGRLPLSSIREGRAVIREAEANPGNRIHRDDLASALADLLMRMDALPPGDGDVFNVSDGNHMSSTAFTFEVARQAGLPEPPQISRAQMKATASSVRWSFLAESRRLSNAKLLEAIEQPLKYSDPVDGIAASLAAPDDPAA